MSLNEYCLFNDKNEQKFNLADFALIYLPVIEDAE